MRGMQPQAKDAWSPQELEEAGGTLPRSLCREPGPATLLISDSGLQNWKEISVVIHPFVVICYSLPRKLIQQGAAFQTKNVPEKCLWLEWGGGGGGGRRRGTGAGGQGHLVTVVTSEPHPCGQVTQGSQDGALHEAASLGPSSDGTLPVSLSLPCPSQVTLNRPDSVSPSGTAPEPPLPEAPLPMCWPHLLFVGFSS